MASSLTAQERTILLLLAFINFTHILDFMIMMPLGNFLMPHFQINAGAFAAVVASYNFAAFASGVLAAFVVDRYDRKQVLLFGYIGFLAGTLLCAIAPTYWLLMGARIIAGLFGGLIGAQVLSIVADVVPYQRRGIAMGWLMAAFSLASVLGVPLSLYLAKFFNWHAPFLLIVAVGLPILLAAWRFIPSVKSHMSAEKATFNPGKTLATIFTVPTQRAALLLSGSILFGHFVIIPFINPYMEYNMGFSRDQTPIIYMVGGATTIISGIVWGRLADKYGKLKIFTISGALSIIPVLFITDLPAWPFAVVLIPFAMWFGMANGRTITMQAMVSQVIQPQARGSFMSINSSVQQLFTGIAGTVAGLIVYSDEQLRLHNYHILGYISVVVIAICLWLARRLGVQ